MSLDAEREPITRPVFVWLEIAARLDATGDRDLAVEIRHGVDGRPRGDNVTLPLTVDEQLRVNAALQDWRGARHPDEDG